MTYKQNKLFAAIVSNISTSTHLDVSVVMHFINADLERIYREKQQINGLRFTLLDAEIEKLQTRENTLHKELSQKEALLRDTSSRLEAASASLKAKSESLTQAHLDVEQLRKKIAELDSSLHEASKAKRQLEYDLMMKRHQRRERTDKSAQVNRILLTIFSLLAIAIAFALIWKMDK